MLADSDTTREMPWRIEDIDLTRIDRQRAAANEDLLLLLCAASFIESGSDLYTSNLSQFFDDDPEVSAWLNAEWEHEELQHGRALKAYIAHVWPEFDWDLAFANFFEEYSKTCSVEAFEKTRALEMVARCVVETGTATLYRAINECSDEPVLKEITDNIRTDEVRHYKHFFRYFKKYNKVEGNGRLAVLGALTRRVLEIKSEDSEIALRHVFAIRYPDRVGDSAYCRERTARVNALVRRYLSADMCVKMLLKPLDLPAKIQPGVHYPLTKLTQHVFFR
ncbi:MULTISPECIES: ferritin-like domain-containing protein [Burkholderia]|uniref:Ferritin-like domain-containing protein n=2 Tax=Burkholderia humptydooensis TaxID=430531 RepID=A0A7U4STE7_9BURK|nr:MULTISPECIES: ferritin-like domain-containing protein [Burkholderia]ATF37485.1 ferritin [Burkholderia thailandensis]ALX43667.1 ferritin [Burkholderia humptydooensis]KST75363.1 ferritin [Burkholderia humptydooensis]KVN13669.1 ferritin [Burkholderia sp. MSMB1552]KWZ54907.1 ferritin [Burkholderia sp. MSMB1588]